MITFKTILAGEIKNHDVDLSALLPPAATAFVSATASVKKLQLSGLVESSFDALLASTTCTVLGTKIRFKISGAVAAERYRVEISATTNDSQIVKDRVYFRCDQ